MSHGVDDWLDGALQQLGEDSKERGLSTAPHFRPQAPDRPVFRLRYAVSTLLSLQMLVGAGAAATVSAALVSKTIITGTPNPFVWHSRGPSLPPSLNPELDTTASPSPEHSENSAEESSQATENSGEGSSSSPESSGGGDGGSGSGETTSSTPEPTSGGDGGGGGTSGGDGGSSNPTPSPTSDH